HFSSMAAAHTESYPLFLHDALPIYELPSINIDYRGATKDSTQLLIDHGHEKIALLGIDIDSKKQKMTKEGYKEAIEESDLTYDEDRKSTRLNSSHVSISYAVFCLKK